MKNRKHTNPILFGLSELDLWHHTVLILIFISSFLAILFVAPSKSLQIIIGIITAGMYIGWGAVHHYYDQALHILGCLRDIYQDKYLQSQP